MSAIANLEPSKYLHRTSHCRQVQGRDGTEKANIQDDVINQNEVIDTLALNSINSISANYQFFFSLMGKRCAWDHKAANLASPPSLSLLPHAASCISPLQNVSKLRPQRTSTSTSKSYSHAPAETEPKSHRWGMPMTFRRLPA